MVEDAGFTTAQQALKAPSTGLPIYLTMTEPLRPQHFITRQNGTMVPLVALDELPATIALRGVPRTLSPYDVAGMTGLGTMESQHRQYVVDGPPQGFQPEQHKVAANGIYASKYATAASNHHLASSFGELGLHDHAASSTTHSPQSKAYGIKETQSTLSCNMSNDPVRSAESASRPLTIEDLARNPAPGVKEYCSYWLRHGECDYAQQGCLYRHEMPLDPPTLEKLGLRDIPRWYREKHGLGSYLALGLQKAGSGSTRPLFMERNWRNQSEAAKSTGTKTPVTPSEPQNGLATKSEPHNAVSSWNAFANKHTAAYNSTTRGRQRSPPEGRQTSPAAKQSTNNRHPTPPQPRTHLVPANTENVSTRILREANEQLDAREEQERAALSKYTPLVPQRTGFRTIDSGIITPPPTSEEDASSIGTTGSGTEVSVVTAGTADPAILPSARVSVAALTAAASATVLAQQQQQKKKTLTTTGRRARPRRAAAAAAIDHLDREAQRKAVARARHQAEELAGITRSRGKTA